MRKRVGFVGEAAAVRASGFPDGLRVEPRSVVSIHGAEIGVSRSDGDVRLAVLAAAGSAYFEDFDGKPSGAADGKRLLVGPASPANVAALRERLPWLWPGTLGLATSAGLGDRLGLATPGHVRAIKAVGGAVAPIFAQQSIREMERTGRTPQQVMDDATWGVFSEGWRGGFGADADHLKTPEDVDACVAAGYTFFTFDPGEHVDDRAESLDASGTQAALESLPWAELEDTPEDLRRRYLAEPLRVEGREIPLDEAALFRAAAKYGRAVAHAARLYRHLEGAAGRHPFEVEVSVDETDSVTTHAQHAYIAGELRRLGVRFVSLAPRYVGRFEKGVDYIGSVEEFAADFAVHAAIARELGPYKLSLHSGSDKFAIYEIAVEETRGLVHLKTAGTSYLEALRTAAALDPDLFREVYAFARGQYEEDRASYHVSAELEKAPEPEEVGDAELPGLLEQFDAREVLHVTFGSVLRERIGERFKELLRSEPEAYAANLERHFVRHLEPFGNFGRKGGA